MLWKKESFIQDGEDPVQSLWKQGNAHPNARIGRSRQDHHFVQVKARSIRKHNPHRWFQRRNRHIQKCQIQCLGKC